MGEIAALLTACCWALSSLFSSIAGKSTSSMTVNRFRLILAVIYITISHLILTGSPLPLNVSLQSWLWLGLSGIIGLVIGDGALYQSYILIGVRLGTLIMSTVPVISTLIAWIFLGENLSFIKIFGIVVTVVGIGFVVLERNNNGNGEGKEHHYLAGILWGLLGAIGQAVGLVFSKMGLTADTSTISGLAIRMLVALITIWILTLVTGQVRSTVQQVIENPRAMKMIVAASIVGPFIGVWLSLVAVRATYVGIASVLMALTPIILLPVVKWGFKEKVSSRAVVGTVVAMVGVAVIFMGP